MLFIVIYMKRAYGLQCIVEKIINTHTLITHSYGELQTYLPYGTIQWYNFQEQKCIIN